MTSRRDQMSERSPKRGKKPFFYCVWQHIKFVLPTFLSLAHFHPSIRFSVSLFITLGYIHFFAILLYITFIYREFIRYYFCFCFFSFSSFGCICQMAPITFSFFGAIFIMLQENNVLEKIGLRTSLVSTFCIAIHMEYYPVYLFTKISRKKNWEKICKKLICEMSIEKYAFGFWGVQHWMRIPRAVFAWR